MWVDCTDLPWVVCGSAILEKTPRARNFECIACTIIQSFEGGAIPPRTARSLTTIADGGLFVKKAHLAHIFSYVVAYNRVLVKREKV